MTDGKGAHTGDKMRGQAERLLADWRGRPRWWREIAYCVVFYVVYSFIRNATGSVLSVQSAFRNAYRLVDWERSLGIFNEAEVQGWFLDERWLIKALNIYYGTAHFIVTIGVLLWLFRVQVARYHRWRNVIFATTALALVGYLTFPLAPPRFLPAEQGYFFIDTVNTIGGMWSFESGTVQQVSNQYAAMPSLHVAWSLWCALAVVPVLRRWWTKALIIIYPLLTTLTIVVTANHYWLDVAGGILVFACGYCVAELIERRVRDQFRARFPHLWADDPDFGEPPPPRRARSAAP